MTKKLLYTREKPLQPTIEGALAKKNIDVLAIPLIKTLALDYQLPEKNYDWLFFTSANTVKNFSEEKILATTKIAVIGEKTLAAAVAANLTVDFVATTSCSEAFVAEWLEYLQHELKVEKNTFENMNLLLPQSKIARPILAELLENAGFLVTSVAVYDTIFPVEQKKRLLAAIEEKAFVYAAFASPSAWKNFYQLFLESSFKNKKQEYFQEVQLLSIGPITTAAIEEDGCQVALEPKNFTMDALFDALIQELNLDE